MGHGSQFGRIASLGSLAQAVGIGTRFLYETVQNGTGGLGIVARKGREGGKIVTPCLRQRSSSRRGGQGTALDAQLGKQFLYRERFVQATRKAVFDKLLARHIATGGHRNDGDGARLAYVGGTQQLQQVEAVDGQASGRR